MSIIIFLVILAILILVHEFGHFIVAKRSGVRVDEFGLGFPPRLFGVKKGETLYSINAIPFGGFVKIFGENPDEEGASEGPEASRSFIHKPRYIQAAILVAGVFFNLLLAWVFISVGFMAGLPMPSGSVPQGALIENARLTITGVEADSPAEAAGFRPGDVINSVSAQDVGIEKPTIAELQSFIRAHGEEEITIHHTRGGVKIDYEKTLIPTYGILENTPAIGISMDTIGRVTLPPHRAVWEAGKLTVGLTWAVTAAFGALIADAFQGEAEISNLTGPVGIIGLVGDAADFGFVYLLGFTALISINLAVINLIPFPALDGGRLLFVGVEAIKRSPLNPKVVGIANVTGFVLLIILLLIVTYHDIVRIF